MPTRRSTRPARSAPQIKELRAVILPIARDHGVRNVRLFGSFARGEERKNSDVDLIVDLPDEMSLLGLVGFKLELEGALGRKVDVVPSKNIKPYLREYILADARPL